MSNFGDVGKFHEKFGLHSATQQPGPQEVDEALLKFRVNFMQEELDEFRAAHESDDKAGMFDALIDLVYVAMGTAHLLGYPWEIGWDAVQRANMAKERATEKTASERGGTWDVIKPEGWTPPNIEGILYTWGWDKK